MNTANTANTAMETTVQKRENRTRSAGITGSTLKLIAIITMFIDHTGAIILERMIISDIQGGTGVTSVTLLMVDSILRLIGRMGFPIFCFLLIEGFVHTHNVKKYAGRLLLFALLSEIPFNLAFAGKLFFWQYQNVFFTLLAGLLVMMGFRLVEERAEWNKAVRAVLHGVTLAAGMALAQLLHTDYGAFGVLTIIVMYLFRNHKTREAGAGCITLTLMSLSEITSFFVMLPIHKYNGERGWNMKWIFYVFYPAHILLLYLAAYMMGYGQVPLYTLF